MGQIRFELSGVLSVAPSVHLSSTLISTHVEAMGNAVEVLIKRPIWKRYVLPATASVWLTGSMGQAVIGALQSHLRELPEAGIVSACRFVLVEMPEVPPSAASRLEDAVTALEHSIGARFPSSYRFFGPIFKNSVSKMAIGESNLRVRRYRLIDQEV